MSAPHVEVVVIVAVWRWAVIHIRRGKKDNYGIIFHITPLKYMLGTIIRTVSSCRNGSNKGSQHYVFIEN